MAWNRLIQKKNIYKKRRGIKYFFYTILKYEIEDKISFKDDLLTNFIFELNKSNVKVLFFTVGNIIKENKTLNTIYIIIWKESILKKDKDIEELFENIKSNLNIIFNFKLVELNEKEHRMIFEKIFPFNIL